MIGRERCNDGSYRVVFIVFAVVAQVVLVVVAAMREGGWG